MKSRRKYIGFVFVLVAMFFVPFSSLLFGGDTVFAADQPIKLKVLSSWDPTFFGTRYWLIPFGENK